jgi:hypothetical protein
MWEVGVDRARAVELARSASRDAQGATLAEIKAWLKTHAA